ncbi:MAG: PTS sugar transporter subunit IIA, partial [Planctomycetaceae bacterium]|nr:PTS sugar transporter subunit IIA [Planctomycetaceae bacterium]
LFVALVVMAIVTSMMSGPLMRWILRPAKRRLLLDSLSSKLFVRHLVADSPRTAINELVTSSCDAAGLDGATVEASVWEREETLSTGLGHGVAIPHARLAGLSKPIVAVGISDAGIDFDAPDGELAHVVFLLLTPQDDALEQLKMTAEIAHYFRDPHLVERVLRTTTFEQFRSLLRRLDLASLAE